MRLFELLTPKPIAWLTCHRLRGYLRIAKTVPWADVNKALEVANIDDLSLGVVCDFLDLEAYTEREVNSYELQQFLKLGSHTIPKGGQTTLLKNSSHSS